MDHVTATDAAPAPPSGAADRIAAELRRAIHAGRYAPGTRLVERTLARQFDTSHIPVREALARLSDEGLVVRLPRRGARVAALSPKAFDEVCDVRVLLERFVALRVQQRLTPGHLAELSEIVDAMDAAARAQDAAALQTLDVRFHARLAELAEHGIVSELVGQLQGRVNAFLADATASLDGRRLVAHADSHRRLLDAIAHGTPAQAQRAAERHIRTAAARVSQAFEAGER
jgi:DNA-binding GntR family transcriptional regulator